MPLDQSPDFPKIGAIEIGLYLTGKGTDIAFGFEGITKDAAIGYLQVVQDRMRKERETEWDTCPGCRLPWAAHAEDWEEDEAEEDDDFGAS